MAKKFFCGVEGGASVSKIVIVNENGEIICSTVGPSTNMWLDGLEECHKRLAELIKKAIINANLPSETVLEGLGLSMSGCEDDNLNREFEKKFLEKFPNLSKHCTVTSDTIAPLYTASDKGGLVLIAGTGSNSLLLNPDGTMARCGGWGHMLGDEASAMWISLNAVKAVFDEEDNLVKSPHSIDKVKELMLEHFQVKDKVGLLKHCYTNFQKSFFAGLCAKLAAAAVTEKDPLCCQVFYDAGKQLARMVIALKPKVHKELLEGSFCLPIVCVGSVFKSWNLMQKGFTDTIAGHLDNYTLMTLNSSSAIGAAFLGAKSSGFTLPINFTESSSVVYSSNQK